MAAVEGNYARHQIASPSRVVAWSHRSRFLFGAAIVRELGARRVLDYGCGDGTFLRFVSPLVDECAGFDLEPEQLATARNVCADLGNASFFTASELAAHERRYDAVFCTEVLEHCLPAAVDKVLGDLSRLVRPGGAVVISVPIETGTVLLGKHAMRTILGLRRVGDYRHNEAYSLPELLTMVFATESSHIERPVYGGDAPFHSHKGFNWQALAKELRRRFAVDRPRFSPLGWSRGCASSQAWLVCHVR
jgi:2-polyprenyl-3-methyl-5-hydroxy-6-metoxy-1,4-benzoquinol methylase